MYTYTLHDLLLTRPLCHLPLCACALRMAANAVLSTTGVVCGSWLGAFFIPLDWDRPWQVIPPPPPPLLQVMAIAPSPPSPPLTRCRYGRAQWPRVQSQVSARLRLKFPGRSVIFTLTFASGYVVALLLLLVFQLLHGPSRGAKKDSE